MTEIPWSDWATRSVIGALDGTFTTEGVVVATAAVDESATVIALSPTDIGGDRRFEIGSVTKTMTATLFALLAGEGALCLDDEIGTWLSAGANAGITIRQLATHTSGLPALAPNFRTRHVPWSGYTDELAEEGLRQATVSPPGTWLYSNLGFHLLSVILERASGQDYPTLLTERLLAPLSMTHSGVGQRGEGTPLPGHADGREIHHWDQPNGAGGVKSTIDDLARYAKACLFPPATPLGTAITLAQRPIVPIRVHETSAITVEGDAEQGLGWVVRGGEDGVREHSGGTGGFSACLSVDRRRRRAVAILVSNQGSPAYSAMLKQAARLILAGEDPGQMRAPQPHPQRWPTWRDDVIDVTRALLDGRIAQVYDRLAPQRRAKVTVEQLGRSWANALLGSGAAGEITISGHETAASGAVAADIDIAFAAGPRRLRIVVLPNGELGGFTFLPPAESAAPLRGAAGDQVFSPAVSLSGVPVSRSCGVQQGHGRDALHRLGLQRNARNSARAPRASQQPSASSSSADRRLVKGTSPMHIGHARAASRLFTGLVVGGVLALSAATPATAAPVPVSAPARAASTATAASEDYRAVCPTDVPAGFDHCDALLRTNVTPQLQKALAASPNTTPAGYGPSSLQSAYNLTALSASNGAGETVAVVDAYNDPNMAADLAVYRAQYGLPACTVASGCLTIESQTGSTVILPPNAPADNDWTLEDSLDIDMISAICPNCRLLLVEATAPTDSDLGGAVDEAVSQGAKFVSLSYGGAEASTENELDTEYYDHPGTVVVASAGDDGYGVEYPAASPYVTSVGGTTLTAASNARGWTETAWSGSGSGCSAYEPKPAWQKNSGCAKRTVADVSAVADPDTGLAVYDSANNEGGWLVLGGTSASAPIIAGVYALAGNPAAGTNPASYPYAHPADLYDVTSGSNGTCTPAYLCTAGAGYDGPTGLGTPHGAGAFASDTAAFQANTTSLWTAGSGGKANANLGMLAGTNPSIALLASGGYEEAFQANTGVLWVTGVTGNINTGLGMKADTSPSIAAAPGGGFEVAYQATTGSLCTYTTTGGGYNLNLGLMAGTSPSIAALSNSTYEIAFQANTGYLWEVGAVNNGATAYTMMSTTSPSITALGSSFEVAFQSATGYLAEVGSTNNGVMSLGMMKNTNPAITQLTSGGFEVAFQANTGNLWEIGAVGKGNTALGMMAGTSPAIAAMGGSAFEVAFQATNAGLWDQSPTLGGGALGLGMLSGTSPSIAP